MDTPIIKTRYRYAVSFLLLIVSSAASAQKEIPLYLKTVPNSKGKTVEKHNEDKTIYHSISHPTLRIYLPKNRNAKFTAVIICGGGGYTDLHIKREGYDIAKSFNDAGVAAFVLKYRLPDDETNVDKSLAPLQDAQQAIKLVKDSAAIWNIDPGKIGIMGFSAGGHLASSAGVHYNEILIPQEKKTNLRPDFMILVYPVISFTDTIAHIGSRYNLIGAEPSGDLIKFFSSELHVNKQTPPAFLVHSGDDNIVPVANSVRFYENLKKHNVNAALHIYSKGGHGFVLTPSFEEWFGRCLHWMKSSGFIGE